MSEGITVSPFYYSAVNEITKPNSLVFLSHYFVDRWMRDLGPVGTAIVAVLRSHCYQNRTTHELRNRIQLSVPAIAAEVGVSPKTIRREMEANQALQKFIQRREEYAPGPTPQSLRTDAYSYLVAMDDPVHPLDQDLLQDVIREKVQRMEKGGGEEDAKARARQRQERTEKQKPPGQFDQAAQSRVVNLTTPPGQFVHTPGQFVHTPGQIDQTLKDSLDSLEFKENPSSEFSLTLFPDKNVPEPEWASVPHWKLLSGTEQQPWLEQARRELVAIHTGSGITPKPKLVEVRAKNLYEMSLKKLQEVSLGAEDAGLRG